MAACVSNISSTTILAFTSPIQLVSYASLDRVTSYQRASYDPQTNEETVLTFFSFSTGGSERVRARLSNFDPSSPLIQYRPYVRDICLAPADYDRHLVYIRTLNSPEVYSRNLNRIQTIQSRALSVSERLAREIESVQGPAESTNPTQSTQAR